MSELLPNQVLTNAGIIEPCANCGGQAFYVSTRVHNIACNCGMETRLCDTLAEAIATWNRRTPAAPSVPQPARVWIVSRCDEKTPWTELAVASNQEVADALVEQYVAREVSETGTYGEYSIDIWDVTHDAQRPPAKGGE